MIGVVGRVGGNRLIQPGIFEVVPVLVGRIACNMFGTKLRTWMEAHIVRSRKKKDRKKGEKGFDSNCNSPRNYSANRSPALHQVSTRPAQDSSLLSLTLVIVFCDSLSSFDEENEGTVERVGPAKSREGDDPREN